MGGFEGGLEEVHRTERELEELDARPALPRTLGYLRLMGPGWMQSAMTLGGGTAFASLFAGAASWATLVGDRASAVHASVRMGRCMAP